VGDTWARLSTVSAARAIILVPNWAALSSFAAALFLESPPHFQTGCGDCNAGDRQIRPGLPFGVLQLREIVESRIRFGAAANQRA
jgi:hypothetical protein